MQVLQTPRFRRTVKKLHSDQKADLDEAVRAVMEDPATGDMKAADLLGVRVYKFRMVNQLAPLAYTFESQTITLTLLALGSHENFYRDPKRK